jgi:hypothetical protein
MSQYIIFITEYVLQKTKSNSLKDTTADRLHNSTGNQSGAITCLGFLTEVLQLLLSF